MKLKKITLIFFLFVFTNLQADTPYFIDFKYVLNESIAGKKAQKDLKNQLDKGLESIKSRQKKISEDEKKNNSTKKTIRS